MTLMDIMKGKARRVSPQVCGSGIGMTFGGIPVLNIKRKRKKEDTENITGYVSEFIFSFLILLISDFDFLFSIKWSVQFPALLNLAGIYRFMTRKD